ncbi:quinol dehydrogenase periplasmic component [compost metagenome]
MEASQGDRRHAMSDKMSRQQFLREGLSRFIQGFWGDTAATESAPAADWLRPPGALPEAEFLQACTRCDLCVKICPHWALKVATRHDAPPLGTPFLHDPEANACARCPDQPCISSCPTGALRPPLAAEG